MSEKRAAADGVFDCLDRRLYSALEKRNIHAPSSVQRLVIPRLLLGESLAFCSATGTGKTFAYLLPVLQRLLMAEKPPCGNTPPLVLILAPTLELASQIKAETDFLLKASPVKSVLCTSGGNTGRRIDVLKKEKPAIVIGTVNCISGLVQQRKLKLSAVECLVLDEADRFIVREQVEETRELLRALPAVRQNIFLSSTISGKTAEQFRAVLGCAIPFEQSNDDAPLVNLITHWAVWCESRDRFSTLRAFLSAAKYKKALVFTEKAGETKNIVEKLACFKKAAVCLYSGQQKGERKRALDAFRRGGVSILVASDLAARGLDIEGISHVISLGVHESEVVYTHRAGRTGRYGAKGFCVSMGDELDMRRLQRIEKKLGITVYPKEIYAGRIINAGEEIQGCAD